MDSFLTEGEGQTSAEAGHGTRAGTLAQQQAQDNLVRACVYRPCHPGGHYWDYYPGAPFLSQITATDLKIGYL